jgi:GGDEF domain-containing protein
MKDFFISYSMLDEEWAEWIAYEIETHGYSVMLQKWDFAPGKNLVLELNSAVSYSERIILVLSSHYLLSDFTKSEWAPFFARDPTGEKGLVIPVRVDECTPTGLLGPLVHVDFVEKDADECRELLLGAIKGTRRKPHVPPSFPRNLVTYDGGDIYNGYRHKESTLTVRLKSAAAIKTMLREVAGGWAIAPHIQSRQLCRTFVKETLDDAILDYMTRKSVVYMAPGIKRSQRAIFSGASIAVIDVDGMNGINKKHGVDVGDMIIEFIGERISEIQKRIVSGRIGDDTMFAVVMCSIDDGESIMASMIKDIRGFDWGGISGGLYVTCSGGIAACKVEESANACLTRAALGQQLARAAGGNKIVRGPLRAPKGGETRWYSMFS